LESVSKRVGDASIEGGLPDADLVYQTRFKQNPLSAAELSAWLAQHQHAIKQRNRLRPSPSMRN
jgi:hypothetical protein